jgi:putative spermidine/putrescine transport system permease protein
MLTSRRSDPLAFLVLPACLYLLVIFVVPLVMLTAGSFVVGGQLSLQHYVDYFSDSYNVATVSNTVQYAVLVAFGTLIIGFPYAYLMTRVSSRVQLFLLVATIIPVSSNIIVKLFGWSILLKSTGVINQALMATGLVDTPPRLLFTQPGLYLGSISVQLPFMILPVFSVLRQIPPNLAEAASCLGAGSLYTFSRVILPLSVPGIVAGLVFVYCQTAAAYAIPLLLAGGRFKVMSNEIVTAFEVFNNVAVGSTAAVTLLFTVACAVGLMVLLNRKFES